MAGNSKSGMMVNVVATVTGFAVASLIVMQSVMGQSTESANILVTGEVAPPKELLELRATEAKLLGEYGVVDKATGVYRIPIERAMELVVKEYQSRQAAVPSEIVPAAPTGALTPVEGAASAPSEGVAPVGVVPAVVPAEGATTSH